MREYVVGYYNKPESKEDFVILATMDSKNVAMFVRDSYRDAYKRAGIQTEALLLEEREVPKHHRFAN